MVNRLKQLKVASLKEEGAKDNPRPENNFLPIYFVVFCSFFDTHAQLPVLSPYAVTLGAGPFAIGLITGFYSLFNIAGNFASGVIIDRNSWKAPLFGGLALVGSILLIYPLATTPFYLLLIRAGHGLAGGLLVPAALISLSSRETPLKQCRRLSFFGAAVGLAAISGPLFSGIVSARWSFEVVYFSLGTLIFLALGTTALSTGNLDPGFSLPDKDILFRDKFSFRSAFGRAGLAASFCFAFGVMGATGTLASFLPLRAAEIELNQAHTGMLFAVFGLTAVAVQLAWPHLPLKNMGDGASATKLGLGLLCTAMLTIPLRDNPLFLFFCLALFGIGFGLSFQGMLGLVSSSCPPAWQGRATGLFFAFYSLGVAVVPPLSGLLRQHWSLNPFHSAAIVTAATLVGGWWLNKDPSRQGHWSKPLV